MVSFRSKFGQVKFGVARNERFLNTKCNSRKAQVKFGETIGIIFIVYIVLVVGFVWYNSYSSKYIEEQNEKANLDRAFEKFNYLLKLNLIHKSELGDLSQEIDRTGLIAMSNYSSSGEGREFFRQHLGTSLVTFYLYDIEMNLVESIVVYNNSIDSSREFNIKPFRTVLPVFDGINDTVYVGIIQVLDYRALD